MLPLVERHQNRTKARWLWEAPLTAQRASAEAPFPQPNDAVCPVPVHVPRATTRRGCGSGFRLEAVSAFTAPFRNISEYVRLEGTSPYPALFAWLGHTGVTYTPWCALTSGSLPLLDTTGRRVLCGSVCQLVEQGAASLRTRAPHCALRSSGLIQFNDRSRPEQRSSYLRPYKRAFSAYLSTWVRTRSRNNDRRRLWERS